MGSCTCNFLETAFVFQSDNGQAASCWLPQQLSSGLQYTSLKRYILIAGSAAFKDILFAGNSRASVESSRQGCAGEHCKHAEAGRARFVRPSCMACLQAHHHDNCTPQGLKTVAAHYKRDAGSGDAFLRRKLSHAIQRAGACCHMPVNPPVSCI